MNLTKPIEIFLATVALCTAANASTIFNFDNDSLGTSTQFTDTVDGLSATFSSSADPGSFVVYGSMFETLTGNVLGDPGPAGLDGLALSVAFSRDLAALTLNFATADFNDPSPFTLAAYENSTLLSSVSSKGTFLDGFSFPEGEIAITGRFNRVVISSTAPDFAVDNLNAVTATPEPAVFMTSGIGLIALSLLVRRRKSLSTSPASSN